MSKKIKIIIFIIILIIALASLIIYLNNRIIDDNSGFTLKEDLTLEVYTKANLEDYIENIEGKIIKKSQINNKNLGKKS